MGALLRERFVQKNLCLVTDAFLHKSGMLAPALASLAEAGFKVQVIDDVVADPPENVVLAATRCAREAEAEIILGLGGGSSMDVAKLIAVLAGSNQPLSEMYGIGKVNGQRLPLIQMPTTAGTGSEVTPISIVTTGETTKVGVVSPQLYADLTILDAELTLGLPPKITAAIGIDAIVHAIEAYTTKSKKNPLSDMIAREGMLLGAMLAGQAFANAPVAAAQYAELAAIAVPGVSGSDEAKAAAFIEFLENLAKETGIERCLRHVGISDADIPRLTKDAMLQTRLLVNNPREVTEADVAAIYHAALD